MTDYRYIELKLNDFFSKESFSIRVIPKEKNDSSNGAEARKTSIKKAINRQTTPLQQGDVALCSGDFEGGIT